MLVVFMVGCENSVNLTQSQTQTDNEGISLAKGGGKPSSDCSSIKAGEVLYEPGHYLEVQVIPTGFKIISCASCCAAMSITLIMVLPDK